MKKLNERILFFWNERPLPLILFLAAFFRMLAVIFSKGFGMQDDHFLIIEAAQSWVDGFELNVWFPFVNGQPSPTGHSLFYPGIHYLLFSFFKWIGLDDAQTKMFFVRLIHGAYSLIAVWGTFKIADKLQGIKAARESALLIAILFFIPMLSVRNLVEVVSMPPLVIATWLIIKKDFGSDRNAFFSGALLSVAFSVRFQTLFFVGAFIGTLILMRKWRCFFWTLTGFIVSLAIIQLLTDIAIWKKPFVEITEYVRYNMANKETYGVSAWYKYIILIAGILIPPISLMIIAGYFYSWRKYLLIFLPSFAFILVHSIFPNKQERFILPVLPFVIMGGCMGWYLILEKFKNRKLYKFHRIAWVVFFILNTIPLFVVSTAYSKRSRVESMAYLNEKADTESVLIEESIHDEYKLPPLFYFGKWGHVYHLNGYFPMDSLLCELSHTEKNMLPQYVIFNQQDDLEKRVTAFRKIFPELKYETTIYPGFLDDVLHKLNPHNANFSCYIYRINYSEKDMEMLKNFHCN